MKTENPAKLFLRRYRALCGRANALQEAINEARDRAAVTSLAFSEKVQSSPKQHDPMAESVARYLDDLESLYNTLESASVELSKILQAIDSLPDEVQKEVLTRRYINGESYESIARKMHYSTQNIYVIHGNALAGINRWLEGGVGA